MEALEGDALERQLVTKRVYDHLYFVIPAFSHGKLSWVCVYVCSLDKTTLRASAKKKCRETLITQRSGIIN